MRVPKDKPLSAWIKELIAQDKVEVFYATADWKELRAAVMDDFHHECQECLKRGEYTEATCVHHCNEVRNRPDLALSRYYVDSKGERQPNLVPLCNQCHNQAHNRFENWQRENGKEKFFVDERW